MILISDQRESFGEDDKIVPMDTRRKGTTCEPPKAKAVERNTADLSSRLGV